jgi:hypothetical protein
MYLLEYLPQCYPFLKIDIFIKDRKERLNTFNNDEEYLTYGTLFGEKYGPEISKLHNVATKIDSILESVKSLLDYTPKKVAQELEEKVKEVITNQHDLFKSFSLKDLSSALESLSPLEEEIKQTKKYNEENRELFEALRTLKEQHPHINLENIITQTEESFHSAQNVIKYSEITQSLKERYNKTNEEIKKINKTIQPEYKTIYPYLSQNDHLKKYFDNTNEFTVFLGWLQDTQLSLTDTKKKIQEKEKKFKNHYESYKKRFHFFEKNCSLFKEIESLGKAAKAIILQHPFILTKNEVQSNLPTHSPLDFAFPDLNYHTYFELKENRRKVFEGLENFTKTATFKTFIQEKNTGNDCIKRISEINLLQIFSIKELSDFISNLKSRTTSISQSELESTLKKNNEEIKQTNKNLLFFENSLKNIEYTYNLFKENKEGYFIAQHKLHNIPFKRTNFTFFNDFHNYIVPLLNNRIIFKETLLQIVNKITPYNKKYSLNDHPELVTTERIFISHLKDFVLKEGKKTLQEEFYFLEGNNYIIEQEEDTLKKKIEEKKADFSRWIKSTAGIQNQELAIKKIIFQLHDTSFFINTERKKLSQKHKEEINNSSQKMSETIKEILSKAQKNQGTAYNTASYNLRRREIHQHNARITQEKKALDQVIKAEEKSQEAQKTLLKRIGNHTDTLERKNFFYKNTLSLEEELGLTDPIRSLRDAYLSDKENLIKTLSNGDIDTEKKEEEYKNFMEKYR